MQVAVDFGWWRYTFRRHLRTHFQFFLNFTGRERREKLKLNRHGYMGGVITTAEQFDDRA